MVVTLTEQMRTPDPRAVELGRSPQLSPLHLLGSSGHFWEDILNMCVAPSSPGERGRGREQTGTRGKVRAQLRPRESEAPTDTRGDPRAQVAEPGGRRKSWDESWGLGG